MSDEQFLTSPFLPARFHLFSHQLNFLEGPSEQVPRAPGHLLRLPRPLGRPVYICMLETCMLRNCVLVGMTRQALQVLVPASSTIF